MAQLAVQKHKPFTGKDFKAMAAAWRDYDTACRAVRLAEAKANKKHTKCAALIKDILGKDSQAAFYNEDTVLLGWTGNPGLVDGSVSVYPDSLVVVLITERRVINNAGAETQKAYKWVVDKRKGIVISTEDY